MKALCCGCAAVLCYASAAGTPSGTILLYTLFQGNAMFMNFVLARTDLEALVRYPPPFS